MYRFFLTGGTIMAALAVILGAFGAHALKNKISVENLQVFETGVRYQMYHALALIFICLLSQKINSSLLSYSGWLFFMGILFFSGSVYLLACREILGIENWKTVLGPITPIGGFFLIAGWITLACASLKFDVKY